MDGCLAASLDTVTKVALKFTVSLTVEPVDSFTLVLNCCSVSSRSYPIRTCSDITAKGTLVKYS